MLVKREVYSQLGIGFVWSLVFSVVLIMGMSIHKTGFAVSPGTVKNPTFGPQADDVDAGWPSGSYCIYRKGGSCPTGFTLGTANYVTEAGGCNGTQLFSPLPDFTWANPTLQNFAFCCK